MKLIKKGTKLEKLYRAECHTCGSIFEAKRKELKITFERGEECIETQICTECESSRMYFRPIPEGE